MKTTLANPEIANARVLDFEGTGYATEANARRQLAKTAHLWDGCQAMVATQGGRFFPLVVYRPGCCNIPALCGANVAVVN